MARTRNVLVSQDNLVEAIDCWMTSLRLKALDEQVVYVDALDLDHNEPLSVTIMKEK